MIQISGAVPSCTRQRSRAVPVVSPPSIGNGHPSDVIAERSGDSATNLVGVVERAQIDALRLAGEQEGDERDGCGGGQVDRNGHRGGESLQQPGGAEGGERWRDGGG